MSRIAVPESSLLSVCMQIVSDVSLNAILGLEDPEVPLAEDVCLQGQEPFHGEAPGREIGAELVGKGAVDVLAEEDPFISSIEVD